MSEFLEPLDMPAEAIAIPVVRLQSVISGNAPMDAELDLRLGRYFGMSEGFFLRLQDQYELLEAKRALNGELDRRHSPCLRAAQPCSKSTQASNIFNPELRQLS